MAGNRNSYSKRNLILDILIVIAAIALVLLFLLMRRQDNMVAQENSKIALVTAETTAAMQEETVSASEAPTETETSGETENQTQTVAEAQPDPQSADAAATAAPEQETAASEPETETAEAEIVEEVVVQTGDGEKIEYQPAEADEAQVVAVAPVELTPVPTEEPKSYGSLRVAVLGGMFSAFGSEDAYYPDGEVIQESEMWWAAAMDHIPYEILSVVNASAVGTAYSLDTSAENAPWQEDRLQALGASGDPDLILVMIGEEDPAYGESGQAMANETEQALLQSPASSARGAALTFNRLMASWPNARLVVLIPPETQVSASEREGMTVQRFNWAMNEVDDTARQMGIEVIDLRDCQLSTDGVYPTMADMVKMANWVSEQLTQDIE